MNPFAKGNDDNVTPEKIADFVSTSASNLFDRVGVGIGFAVPGTPIRVGVNGGKQLAVPASSAKPNGTTSTSFFDSIGVGAGFTIPGTSIHVGGGGSKQLNTPAPAPCNTKQTETTTSTSFFDSIGVGAGFTIPGTSIHVGGGGSKQLTGTATSESSPSDPKKEESSEQSTVTNGLANVFDSVGLSAGYVIPGTSIVIGGGGSKNLRKS